MKVAIKRPYWALVVVRPLWCSLSNSLNAGRTRFFTRLIKYSKMAALVNFSPMSPKLFRTYPHREEDRGIDLAPLFLWLVLLKLLCNQLKIFVNLTFSQKVWPIFLFWFTSCAELRVTFWFCCGKNVKLSLLSVIKEVWCKKCCNASAGKVLRRFRCHGEKFTLGAHWEFECIHFF